MLRILGAFSILITIALVAWGVITFYDENLKLGRMWETPAIKPHEEPITKMDANTVPFNGGEAILRQTDPYTLTAPIGLTGPADIAAGQTGYQRYCIQCHGKFHDGAGTVGQSFAPLPGDLRSTTVQTMPVGLLFHEVSYGKPGGRQPALASTIAVYERWQIIAYVKSLGLR